MIEMAKPRLTWVETPRTIPSFTPMAAIWPQDEIPHGSVSGCPIWTPSSVKMAGCIVALALTSATLPITQCGVQSTAMHSTSLRRPELAARSTGSHCGGHATAWLIFASLTLGVVMCGMKAVQKAAATPMRTSALVLEGPFLACRLNEGA